MTTPAKTITIILITTLALIALTVTNTATAVDIPDDYAIAICPDCGDPGGIPGLTVADGEIIPCPTCQGEGVINNPQPEPPDTNEYNPAWYELEPVWTPAPETQPTPELWLGPIYFDCWCY